MTCIETYYYDNMPDITSLMAGASTVSCKDIEEGTTCVCYLVSSTALCREKQERRGAGILKRTVFTDLSATLAIA